MKHILFIGLLLCIQRKNYTREKIMIKYIMVSLLVLIALSGVGSANTAYSGYSFDGNGLPEYPNEGVIWSYASGISRVPGVTIYETQSDLYTPSGNYVNYYHSSKVEGYKATLNMAIKTRYSTGGSYSALCGGNYYTAPYDYFINVQCDSTINSNVQRNVMATVYSAQEWFETGTFSIASARLTVTSGDVYSISGEALCCEEVRLYFNESLIDIDNVYNEEYNFTYLIDGETYKLEYGGSEYEFTVDGADIDYDCDDCIHTYYRFEESCGNLIPDSEGTYTEYDGFWATIWDFYTPTGIFDILNSSATKIAIHSHTFIGNTGWVIDPIVNDTTYTLENPNIAWGLKVIVVNESDGELINGAMVKVDQTCYCTDGYSTRQKMTINGMAEFGEMSLQDASLLVMKTGYKICNENTTGYDAFLSGRTNFSGKTWIVKLAPTWSENVSTFYESQNKVDIHFRNEDGNRTSQILDTDTEVYLYYENNNSNDEAMTLKFQSSSTHSHFIDEQSWTITHNDIGHKTIANADFTPWSYAYRAIIYNASIYGWNITIPLTVRNETKEEIIHYENLTTNLWFRHESDGKIDHREDMQIISYARSNNTTLMNIDLEIWEDGAILCYTNLTETDYSNADFPYYYMYEPIYDYVIGSNYTAKMYGFDRTLLEVRHLNCISDNITRKNKLTIIVKNRFGSNLDNAFVYLEEYGSLPTGSNYYASYEGLENGYYRYKATKSGYEAAGWDDVTMSDSDVVRTYTLTESTSDPATANQPKKVDDDELRNLYVCLMSFLLIFILFGGFLYVSK